MRVREVRPGVVEVTASRAELSALMAGARMALDVLQADPRAPADGRDLLAAVLHDYDAALARPPAPPAVTRRSPMHVQIIQFTLKDMDEEGYRAACAQMAPAFAELPGLLAKVWLADPDSGTYGGVYLFEDRAAMEGYAASELFRTVATFPHFEGIVSRDFAVYEDLTRTTQPGLELLAGARA